jgi:hypothetical protein
MFDHKSYRPTASLIELLLYTQLNSPHRVLSAFVKSLTGFTITDAVDLEEREPALTVQTTNMLEYYEPVSLVHSLSKGSDRTCSVLLIRGVPDTISSRNGLKTVPVRRPHSVEDGQ